MTNNNLVIIGAGCISKLGIGIVNTNRSIQFFKNKTNEEQEFGFVDFSDPTQYDITKLIGTENLRSLDINSELTAVCINECSKYFDIKEIDKKRIGLIVGTNTGNLCSTIEFMKDSYTGEKGYLVKPYLLPQAILNYAAGNSAIRFGFKGVNATCAAGHITGISSLTYAHHLLKQGRSEIIFLGAVEEDNEYSRWYHTHNGFEVKEQQDNRCGAFLVVETLENARKNKHKVLFEVLDYDYKYYPDTKNASKELRTSVLNSFEKNGIDRMSLSSLCSYNTMNEVLHILDREDYINTDFLNTSEIMGETYSATNYFQIISLFHHKNENNNYHLITHLDKDSLMGYVLLKNH